MSYQKLTDWFPAKVKPVRKGVYQTMEPDGTLFFNEFDGEDWMYGNVDCVKAKCRQVLPTRLLKQWRGLKK